jgi:hypothetical protein
VSLYEGFICSRGGNWRIGLFYRGQPYEIHIASGIGLGTLYPAHIGLGHLLMTISVAVLVLLAFVDNRSRQQGGDRK